MRDNAARYFEQREAERTGQRRPQRRAFGRVIVRAGAAHDRARRNAFTIAATNIAPKVTNVRVSARAMTLAS